MNASDYVDLPDDPNTVTLGFVRGIAPSRWADRWNRVRSRRRMQLVPMPEHFDADTDEVNLALTRAMPGQFPEGSRSDPRSRHAVQMYEEAVALVVDIDHDLAEFATLDLADLDLVRLLDHPWHDESWPAAEPWAEADWMPKSLLGALEIVATGLGGILMPLPLAKHITDKKLHRIIEVTGNIDGTRVFATWDIAFDGDEIQELIGVLRGRTSRSSR